MIERSELPTVSETLRMLGVEPRRGRARGPCHRGTNPSALSYDDERGVWHCHRCGIGGDVITLARRALELDYGGALRWLGVTPGAPPRPDPERERQRRIERGLERWARETGRRLRRDYYERSWLVMYGRRRLLSDVEDPIGWHSLRVAYCYGPPLDYLEWTLDEIDLARTDNERATAYERWRYVA